MGKLIRFLKDDRGMQTAEYMILGTVMGAGSIGAIKAVRDGQNDKFEQLSSQYDYKSSEYQKLNNKLNKIKWNVTEIINILNEEE